jgi:membrane protein YdbS with pleckstrin-like domain
MKHKRRSKARVVSEPRTVEVITIVWMLTVVTTFACEVGFAISRWLAADDRSLLTVLSGLLLFAALVIGIVALLIMPVVLRSRRLPPPSGVVVFAAVVSAAPIALAAIEVLKR